jgi:prevent-host-death family protein
MNAEAAQAPVYTIRSLRANLRAAIASVRETGVPAVIAERGERPVAVLVDYASWAIREEQDGEARRFPSMASAAQPAANTAGPEAPGPIPPGWLRARSGWGG